MTTAAFLVSAAHKSSGKTTVSLGLARALRRRGEAVHAFKKGPDYIDPIWLARATGQPCYNLDFFTSAPEEIRATFRRGSAGAGVALVEGNKGLFDGMDLHGSDSNAALARLLDLPVVLVVDAQGITRGVAPLLLGYRQFDPALRFAGVILNKVAGPRHEAKLIESIEHHTDFRVLGAVRRFDGARIVEAHLGLVPANEDERAEEKIERLADLVAGQVDLDALLAATQAPARPAATAGPAATDIGRGLRIGIARDAAFGFYYADDLDAFAAAGAELVFFDTLADQVFPPVDALFIGGGFPERHLAALAGNAALRGAIRAAIEAGLPCYAECGGLMYLSEAIEWRGASHPMVGVIPARAVMHERPQGRGYVQLEELPEAPWPPAEGMGDPGPLRAHEFHYSRLEGLPAGARFAYRVRRGAGIGGGRDGYLHRNLLANYAHLRHTADHPWVHRFLAFVRQVRDGR